MKIKQFIEELKESCLDLEMIFIDKDGNKYSVMNTIGLLDGYKEDNVKTDIPDYVVIEIEKTDIKLKLQSGKVNELY